MPKPKLSDKETPIITKEYIEDYDLSILIPYANNNKEHSEEQVDEIIQSIEENGFNDPIIVDEDNIILSGHGRRLAAIKMGRLYVPTIIISWLTDTQKRNFRIKVNRLADMAGYNMENLRVELLSLGDEWLNNLFADIIDLEPAQITTITNELTDNALVPSQVDRNYDFSQRTIQEIKLTFTPEEYTTFLEKVDLLQQAWVWADVSEVIYNVILQRSIS